MGCGFPWCLEKKRGSLPQPRVSAAGAPTWEGPASVTFS